MIKKGYSMLGSFAKAKCIKYSYCCIQKTNSVLPHISSCLNFVLILIMTKSNGILRLANLYNVKGYG